MPGQPYVDIIDINGTKYFGVLVDPNGVLSAPIGSIASLKTMPMVWVNADGATTWNLVYPTVIPPAALTSTILLGNLEVGSTVTPRYLTPGYDSVIAPAAPGIVQFRTPRAGTLQTLRVRQNDPDGNGNPIVYTARLNGVPTVLSTSLLSTDTDGADLVNSVVVGAGVLVDLEVTKAADIGTSPRQVIALLELG